MNNDYTILIVDDEKQNRTLLTELLKDEYRLILAKNGAQALDRAFEHKPDLVLLDVLMPEMDGHEVIQALKNDERSKDIPVIFISALDSTESEERGLELGAVDYISKPFSPSIVRARVRNHIQSVHQRRLLEQLALLDGLTEIPNHRRFSQVYEQEWRRCKRASSPLSLIVVDVDHFKRYNDSHGHSAGDIVLRQVAQTIKTSLKRSGDFVARYGGEEFVILLMDVDQDGAKALAEHVRREVEELHMPHEDSPVSPWVTISLGGVTQVPPEHQEAPGLFAIADAFLYEAKHQGRNRVVWAPPGTVESGVRPIQSASGNRATTS
jgi:diguanylate cyclase (GGDEF)-like protein